MILFKPYHIPLILDGRKTQTRRIWSKPRAKIGSIHKVKTELLSKDHHCLIRILDVYPERLGDISAEDAKAEGGYSIDEFIKAWKRINHEWNPDQVIYVVKFMTEK